MDYSLLLLAAVPVTGFLAGFINTLAGSGSLITLPILILLGLPANVANGTNRVGVLLQNIVAVATFRKRGALETAGSWKLIVPTVLGSVLGAELAVDLDEALLRKTIGALMLVMLVVVSVQPGRWLAAHAAGKPGNIWIQAPLFFAIGIYGGFIQAGVGILLLAGLVLGAGLTLVGANALKNLIVLIFTTAALIVFVVNGQVHWGLGLLLALGQGAGAWVAARLAIARGAKFVHWVLIAILVLSAIALLGDFSL
ncbi:MAG TPA: sulfite exporter TauE/SafE family protein [Gammaproteobacteria bacterium]|nr:sulfite exporter TauE/SafE family protein [Gammaproteobacteria bacterium]